ncbi:MAG: hypothetical protein A2794_00155 [Alphaproteobacteria bacterium RIFCSPHIGHO2_01_FULL_40_8]|nr:MAG: hypothetical protein A2794_00155 [Alphaproteobacteria bacterium RIFCSPHIGHO2_01_FULL_40_8]
MRILHLISSNGFYGAENVVLSILSALKKNGMQPFLICLKSSGKIEPEISLQAKQQDIHSEVISCNGKFDTRAIAGIKAFIRENNIDIVHSHNYKSNLYGLLASRQAGVPIISTLHGWTGENNKIKFYEFIDKHVVKKMDHLVSVSPKINAKATLIPNGVDVNKFDPINVKRDLRKEFDLGNSFVIGTAGRLSREKGQIGLIKAFEKIKEQIPAAKLLIAGEGPLQKDLERYAGKKSLAGSVVFAGKVKDMPSLYKTMDIFVLSSITEGIPIVLLEAMAMQLPVISTDVGGTSYVIDPGKDGILIPPKDVNMLAENLVLLFKSKSLRSDLGQQARKKILDRFSLDSLYRSYLKIYEDINKNAECVNN